MILFQDAFWALSALMSDDKHSMHGERTTLCLMYYGCLLLEKQQS